MVETIIAVRGSRYKTTAATAAATTTPPTPPQIQHAFTRTNMEKPNMLSLSLRTLHSSPFPHSLHGSWQKQGMPGRRTVDHPRSLPRLGFFKRQVQIKEETIKHATIERTQSRCPKVSQGKGSAVDKILYVRILRTPQSHLMRQTQARRNQDLSSAIKL